MNILLIGGTGIISAAVTNLLAKDSRHRLWILNRGSHNDNLPENVSILVSDIQHMEKVRSLIFGLSFDSIIDFTIQLPEQIRRDYELFRGKTKQFIFISSSCVYQKPLSCYQVTESTPVYNPYWDYAQNKIACERELTSLYQAESFPMTIIRPGHTYDHKWLPLCISGAKGCWSVIKRMMDEKPTIIPGDGTSLWTVTSSRDFASALSGIIGNPYAIGEVINISSDEVMTWNQIYENIADALQVPLHPFYISSMFLDQAGPYGFKRCLIGERVQSTVFQNDKLKRLVPGFQPQVPFREGIREALTYLLSHPEEQLQDPVFDHWCDALVSTLTKDAAKLKKQFPSYE